MKYAIDVDRNIDSLIYSLNKLNNGADISDWNITIYASGIDFGIFLNFDLDKKELVISNKPNGNTLFCLDDIIDFINENNEKRGIK